MNLIDLEAFVSVVDHGSIVGASVALHLTQSAVTRRIQSLEDVLNVSLLNRQTRPLQPTPAGKETYEFAKPVLSSVKDLKTAIMDNGEPSGDFRFGMSRILGDVGLSGAIACLRTDFPKIQLRAYVQNSEILLERLGNGSLDATVIVLPEDAAPPASMVAENLGSQPIVILAAKSKRMSPSPTLEELSQYAWLLNPQGCSIYKTVESALLQRRLPFITALEAEGSDLQCSLIAKDLGLGITMPHVFHASNYRRDLKIVKVKDFTPHMKIWLLHPSHIGRLAPAVACLREAVKSYLQRRGSR
ncbi:LysR family transcriptional regulator [Granulicella sp. dw_53]|uniref:LysR family transcriptional regulator n=1 Tax=Granulicella sp. dw_53 TaxID=2719792 RepID=UPI001BD48F52|nr:LysR family transcriptional regulator [Granulicella sp. dw_53]